ncbi:MAG: DUF1080 domain-containing protein [Anaerohalosphaera sp.]|nr:DUF1080 domain-containing protein [Anaerohalosphaera sp.]
MNRIIILSIFIAAVAFSGCSCECCSNGERQNWISLFDGSNVDAWRGINSDKFPDAGWKVEDGMLVFEPGGKRAGDIVTKDEFSSFVLEMEFKLSTKANSGIKYFVVEEMSKGTGGLGLEYQILDDENHPDAKNGRGGNRTMGSLYDLIAADTNKPTLQIGQWNKAKIVSDGMHVEHWLNGMKILEYERGSKEFMDIIAISKYKSIKGFGVAESGHILLQDHGDKMWFRNIRVRVLDR